MAAGSLRKNADLVLGDEVRLTAGVESDHELTLCAGCPGPYVTEILDGALPAGMAFGGYGPVRIAGVPEAAGVHRVRIRVTDVGCTPFQRATRSLVIRMQD